MQKNKIILKKIRNVILLGMIMIIMLGAYYNIKKSRAENVVQITVQVTDTENKVAMQSVTLDATITAEGNYQVELPSILNTYYITQYYAVDGTEVVADAEEKLMLTLTAEQIEMIVSGETETLVADITVDYEKKEVTDGTETLEVYNRTTTVDSTKIEGYMPANSEVEITTIDSSSLTLPGRVEFKKGYSISIKYENETGIIEYISTNYGESLLVETECSTSMNSDNLSVLVYKISDDNSTITMIESEGREVVRFC